MSGFAPSRTLRSVTLGLSAAFALLSLPSAQAATYNLAADWSDVSNPNGVWTYLRAGTAFAGTVPNWSGFGPAWADNGGPGFGFTPNLLNYDGSGSESIDALIGDIVGHTNSGDSNSGAGELSIRFTNPVAGIAQISGAIWDAHITVDREQNWAVFVNDVLQTSGTVLGDGTEGRADADAFLLSAVSVGAGDTVELRLVRAPGQIGGLLGMDMTVEVAPVPAPAALLLMVSAIAGGFRFGQRHQIQR